MALWIREWSPRRRAGGLAFALFCVASTLGLGVPSGARANATLTGFTVTPGGPRQSRPLSATPAVASIPALDSTSDSVGATVAKFRVDESGNATYSIPVQIPPGTAGLAPKLALSYSSRLPNGVMGPGWAVEGTSQVTRCRQARENGDFMSGTTPVDGNPAQVNFTTTDRFCLDGVRLLLLIGNSGAYGADGTTYSPETDPTTLVTAKLTSGSNLVPGPVSFTVKRKDGTTSTYGNTTASPNALITATPPGASAAVNVTWNLSRVQDSVGNYIDYLYATQPSGNTFPFGAGAVEFVLSQVNYTGHLANPTTPTYASVTFAYTTLGVGQVRLGYQAGVAFIQSQQLSSVSVTSGSTTMRYYALSYDTSTIANGGSGSGLPRLKQVKECRDSSQGVCFPATTFAWSAANYSLSDNASQTSSVAFNTLAGFKMADVDGDGRQDFVFAIDGDSHCGSVSAIYVAFLDQTSSHQMTLKTLSQMPVCAPIDLQSNDRAWYLVDYDGDGKADLLIGGAAGTNWKIYPSTGRPSGSTTTVFNAASNLLAGLATPITVPAGMNAAGILADMNGDGLPDFITPDFAGPINPVTVLTHQAYSGMSVRFMTRQSDGSFKFADPVELVLTFSATDTTCDPASKVTCTINFFNTSSNNSSVITNDINGDGRADLTFLLGTTPCNPCQQSPSGPAYVTFDPTLGYSTGKKSGSAPTSTTYYWYQFTANGVSTYGTGTAQYVQEYLSLNTANDNTLPTNINAMYVVDLNGDGLSDLLYQDASDNSGKTYRALINTGAGYLISISVSNITSNGSSPPFQLADINGDGRLDLIYPASSSSTSYNYVSVVPSTSASTGWAFSAPTAAPAGLTSSQGWITLLGDFDGDGVPDFLSVQPTTSNFYTSRVSGSTTSTTCHATDNSASCSRYHAHDVIASFTNGYGATTSVTYQPLTNDAVYERGGEAGYPALINDNYGWGSPVFDVMAPIYVVSQVSSSAPTKGLPSNASSLYYSYAGALVQSGGRGFLGFYITMAFDANDASAEGNQYITTLNSYAQRYPFTGMPETTFKLAFNGTLTRGSTQLDTCANSIEDSGGCFALPGATAWWPNLISTGVIVGYAGDQPYCNGAGCSVPDATKCTSTTFPAQPSEITSGLFTPPATAQPIFSYEYHTFDSQGDLAGGMGTSGFDITATSENYFCYDGSGTSLSRGDLLNTRTITSDGSGNVIAQKLTANTFADDTTNWFLGRMTESTVTFVRPNQTNVTRTTDFTYDATAGLLTSERIQKGGSLNLDMRTVYTYTDASSYNFGNRTGAYQCSSDIGTDTACKSTSGLAQQQSGTQVHRYAKTTYDTSGRYPTGSSLPFYATSGTGHLNEQPAVSIASRDEFGNVTSQSSINGLTQSAEFGAMGRPYFAADNTGKAVTTTYRTCGSGSSQVPCSADTMLKFRAQTVTAGAPATWTYFDLLGRPVLKLAQAFDGNLAGQIFSGSCSYYDGHNRPVYQSEPFFLNVTAKTDGSPNLTTTSTSPCASAAYATKSQYDVLGRVTLITNPDGGTIGKSYVGLNTFTTNPRGYTWEEVKDALGEVIETRDPDVGSDASGLFVDNTYNAAGDVLTITRDALNNGRTPSTTQIVTQFVYDTLGRKTSQTDPDSGTTTFTFNAAGDVITQVDAKNQTVTQSFDAMGRRWQRATTMGDDGNSVTDQWTYDTSANGYGQIAGEVRTSTSGLTFSRTFLYDAYGRANEKDTSIAGNAYSEVTAYDPFSRLMSQQDATSYTVTSTYSAKGFLSSLSDSRAGTLYQVLGMTARGQVSSEKRGASSALATTLGYFSDTGRINTICSGTSCGLQDLTYGFDKAGNLTSRERASSTAPTIEAFANDAINRLKLAQLTYVQGVQQVTPITTASLTYDLIGNICTKNGYGYGYAGVAGCATHGTTGSPHAVTTAATATGTANYGYDLDGNQAGSSGAAIRTLVYDALNELARAAAGSAQTSFQYAPDGDRFLRIDGTPVVWPAGCKSAGDRIFCNGFDGSQTGGAPTTYYVGNVEILKNSNGVTTENRRYLGGVAIDNVIAGQTRYVFADHLGSVDVVASSAGVLVEGMSFDVHGNRRNPSTWQLPGAVPTSTTTGFTGHEHVDSFNFIHMNGRVYDPTLGRMLQADPLMGPGNQSLNRYSYVINNPLALTDPTGYSWWRDLLAAAVVIFAPELLPESWGLWAYAASGFAAGVIQSDHLIGGVYGAFTASLFYGVGDYFKSAGWAYDDGSACTVSLTSVGLTAKSLSSGIVGGVMQSLEGGRFGNGFLSAGLVSAAGPTVESIGNTPGQAVAGAIVGGTVSELSGGKFTNGALTGAFTQMFQEVANGARQGERGRWMFPAGGPTDINAYVGDDGTIPVTTNGILGDPNSFQTLVTSSGIPGYFNPSHGILNDLLETFGQKFFGWSGDPLAQGFASVAAQSDYPLNVIAHSQGVLTVVDAVAYYGLSAQGSAFDFRSGALSYYSAASVIEGGGGTMTWSMPYGDIANLYAPSFNPIQWASGFHDVFCGACTHIANGLQRQ